jgi:hypothetical protein
MVTLCWFSFGEVRLEDRGHGQGTYWEVRGYCFVWQDGVLWYVSPVKQLPLVRVDILPHAVQFSLGFVAGRLMPDLPDEPFRIVGG